MIDNSEFSFSIEEFIQSLNSLEKYANEKEKLVLAKVRGSPKFSRINVGVFRNNDDHSIWQLEKDTDGIEYIVKTDRFASPTQGEWSASSNRQGDCVTLSYMNYPIKKFAKSEFNYDDANMFAEFLVDKANSSKEFAKKLAKTLSFQERLAVQKKFPIFREG